MATTLQNDMNLMNMKREKFRVEIRKSNQNLDLENKRFLNMKKSLLEGKENFMFNIFCKENVNLYFLSS